LIECTGQPVSGSFFTGRPVGALSAAGFFAYIGPLVKPVDRKISL
jgi:hypothetical protein